LPSWHRCLNIFLSWTQGNPDSSLVVITTSYLSWSLETGW
jgi:hypothetical protein